MTPDWNCTVPPGATGLKSAFANVAKNVTGVLIAAGLTGEGVGVIVMVGLSLFTVTLAVPVLTAYVASPL